MRAQDLQSVPRTPAPGEVWMEHRELSRRKGDRFPSECRGQVVVDHVAHGRVEASCDGCTFEVTASLGDVARSLGGGDEVREAWWQR